MYEIEKDKSLGISHCRSETWQTRTSRVVQLPERYQYSVADLKGLTERFPEDFLRKNAAEPHPSSKEESIPIRGLTSGLKALRKRLRNQWDKDDKTDLSAKPSIAFHNLQLGSSTDPFKIIITNVEEKQTRGDYIIVVRVNEPFHGIIGAVSGGHKGEALDVLAAESWSKMPMGTIKICRQSSAVVFVHRQREVCVLTIDVSRALKDLREQVSAPQTKSVAVSRSATRIHCLFDKRRQPVRFDLKLNRLDHGKLVNRREVTHQRNCWWWSNDRRPCTLSLAQNHFLQIGTSWVAEQYITLCGNDKHKKILASY